MAKMKVEFLHHYRKRRGLSLKDRLVAYLPRYAPWAARFAPAANALQNVAKSALGLARERSLPQWRGDRFREGEVTVESGKASEVYVFIDTFNRYFEPENARAAIAVLKAAGYQVHLPAEAERPLCCGRTFLSAGLVDEARAEARRMIETLAPYVERGVPVIGLEPSCLFGLRD
jgi:Fe-S oxidoreductase